MSRVPYSSQRFLSHKLEVNMNAPHGSSVLNQRRPKTRYKIGLAFSSFWFFFSISVNFFLLDEKASMKNGMMAATNGKSIAVSYRSSGLVINDAICDKTFPPQRIIVNEKIVIVPMYTEFKRSQKVVVCVMLSSAYSVVEPDLYLTASDFLKFCMLTW